MLIIAQLRKGFEMPTLAEALTRFLQVDRSPYTTKSYQRILTRMVEAVGPVRDVTRISVEDVEDWFYPAINGPSPLLRSTAVQYLSIVQRFFKDCQARGYIQISPAETLRVRHDEEEPRQDRSIPPAILRDMLAYSRFHKRNYAILLFLIVTGCRTGGIASLTRANLRLDEYRARLKEKGNRWVWVYFGDATAAALREWLAVRPVCDHDYVFTTSKGRGATALTRRGYSSILEELSVKIGADKVYRPHGARHSRGHSLAWSGIPESLTGGVLNHRSKDSTRTYYPNDDERIAATVRLYELAALEDPETIQKVIPLYKKEGAS